jgi:radical SAM superfamily enzyme YgiQ (UPF0313 family)
MKIKFILPALIEAQSPFWRPIKYSLFPPLGIATLAAYCDPSDDIVLVDEHVEKLDINDQPDLVIIQVYITNAKRSYQIADAYRKRGVFVAMGGLHVTSLPLEAEHHADSIFIGPGEETFPDFLKDFANRTTKKRYFSSVRTLNHKPKARRDLIKRSRYLVPNSLVVSRGCPHRCDFCYKDAFYKGGKSFYTRMIDDVLEEIESLPGRHLYFLDDHLLGNPRFTTDLFREMKGMGRLFQGAATIASILDLKTLDAAVDAGLRSLFVGFESLRSSNLSSSNKRHNKLPDYERAISALHDRKVMINGSFVFGLDADDNKVFDQTVEWAVSRGLVTSTFHIATPYPGTAFYDELASQNRILHHDWDLYDTRHAVFKPAKMSIEELEQGYQNAYRNFYKWSNIIKGSSVHDDLSLQLKHFFYTGGWKKFESVWNVLIKLGGLKHMLPVLEKLLNRKSKLNQYETHSYSNPIHEEPYQQSA